MSSRLVAVTFDTHDAARLGQFWANMLGRQAVEYPDEVLLEGDGSQLGLRFVTNSAVKVRPNLGHFHLTSDDAADQQDIVAKALDLGATHLAFGQSAEDGHIVMADPDGNELCVMEPDNNFLAGCGFFGEFACDGSRSVGLFWSSALGWPLCWDLGEETAIQAPRGGTKISWGGEPAAPPEVPRRHRFSLVTRDELDAEADRLVALGATRLDGGEGTAGRMLRLADPDDNDFELASEVP